MVHNEQLSTHHRQESPQCLPIWRGSHCFSGTLVSGHHYDLKFVVGAPSYQTVQSLLWVLLYVPAAPMTFAAPRCKQQKSEHAPSCQQFCGYHRTIRDIHERHETRSTVSSVTLSVGRLTVSRFQKGTDVNMPPNRIGSFPSRRLLQNRWTVCLTLRISPAAKKALSSRLSLRAISSHSLMHSSRRSD